MDNYQFTGYITPNNPTGLPVKKTKHPALIAGLVGAGYILFTIGCLVFTFFIIFNVAKTISAQEISYKAKYSFIIDEAKKMNKLVRDLLKFAQIESGLLEFESDDFLLKDMVESIVAPLNLEIKDRKIDFKVNVDNITVNGDYDMLSSVLNNYVSYAGFCVFFGYLVSIVLVSFVFT